MMIGRVDVYRWIIAHAAISWCGLIVGVGILWCIASCWFWGIGVVYAGCVGVFGDSSRRGAIASWDIGCIAGVIGWCAYCAIVV